MSKCTDNARLGIIGCGATYGGERQHCVARTAWSDHPDRRAHITGALSTIDSLWRGEVFAHPATRGYVELRPGYWGREAPENLHSGAESDETATP